MSGWRHEMKYVVSQAQVVLLQSRVRGLMRLDPHASSGSYVVRSLYFDDWENRCYHENLCGTDPREKLRLRTYDRMAKSVRLECKRKERGMTLKTSCPLTLAQAEELVHGRVAAGDEPLLNKFALLSRTCLMRPVVIVEYERVPFVYHTGNVRVTFDLNIASSHAVDSFLLGDITHRPVMPPGQHLLEVKWDGFLPDPIYHALDLGSLRRTAFSKYCLCRRRSLNW